VKALSAGLLLTCALQFPVAALADRESDDAHCRDAISTQDWSDARISCKAEANDYATQAAADQGEPRAVDLLGEGVAMSDVGLAASQMHDQSAASEAYGSAKDTLHEARELSHDPLTLDLIDRALLELPKD
jgi:hypothetical protein